MNPIGKTLTRHPKKILLLIFLITLGFFYYAFFSEDKLKIDFSLEQMFPENDPEKEIYDDFRSKFSREDLSVLMIYVPVEHPLDIGSLSIVDDVVTEIKNIKNLSSCINLDNFPCYDIDEINYEDLYVDGYAKSQYAKIAYFYDYDKKSKQVYLRVFHHPGEEVSHQFKFSNLGRYSEASSKSEISFVLMAKILLSSLLVLNNAFI